MSHTEALDNRLATIEFLIMSAVVPVDPRVQPDECWSDELLHLWCMRYMNGPAWQGETP